MIFDTILFQGKLCKHTVCLLYHTGVLEPSDDVKSVLLGAKRKRGRPKKLPNCLVKSPVRVQLDPGTAGDASDATGDGDGDASDATDFPVPVDVGSDVPPVQITTRKRKRHDHLRDQAHILKPGLGAPKPPKKTKRLQGEPGSHSLTEQTSPKLPPVVTCKKRKNTCQHEIVFGKHYDKVLWAKYADYVKSKKLTVVIDPLYDA